MFNLHYSIVINAKSLTQNFCFFVLCSKIHKSLENYLRNALDYSVPLILLLITTDGKNIYITLLFHPLEQNLMADTPSI
ncbi:hypothetical protein BpHYR1_008790 [Brachionus plicatilis]|uniref:Uncharacterized protein n=1 Tax=Brachionus plicatilis TaxID=10195 RepID=A0A3M7SCF8_BRAPC|nr:hypothetical protein BpHYR1_008790 [Brachionus plicatilis]